MLQIGARLLLLVLAASQLLASCQKPQKDPSNTTETHTTTTVESTTVTEDTTAGESIQDTTALGGTQDVILDVQRPAMDGDGGVQPPETTAIDSTETTTSETTTTETTAPESDRPLLKETITDGGIENFVPYPVPLSEEDQIYAVHVAIRFNIRTELMFAVMYVESRYREWAVSRNGLYLGIMQVAESNLAVIPERYGVKDLMKYEDNIVAGAYFLSYYDALYNHDVHRMLLYYHGGPSYGNYMINNGYTEDAYTRAVVTEMERIFTEREALAKEMGILIN